MKNNLPIPLTCVAFLALGSFIQLQAASLKVSPAGITIHNVTPGTVYDVYKETAARVTIYNDDTTTHSYLLSTHRPSERGRWEKGYLEIPDPSWCWFEKSEITVSPHSKAHAHLYLKIPEQEQYYNQHWIVTLGIAGTPGPMGISLAVDVRVQIETKSKADIKARPHGTIAFKPSTVRFEKVTPGTIQQAKVTIYNNDKEAHTYSIIPMSEDEAIKPHSYLTRSFLQLPDSSWLIPDTQRLSIKPDSAAELQLTLKIPDEKAYLSKKWEEILLVEPDKGLPGFFRVQIETTEKPEEKK